MKPATFLRIASVITFFFFAGHTSGIPWTPDVGPTMMPVIDAMKSNAFDAVGSSRTLWDFYFGFGLTISLYLLLLAVLLWQLASFAKTDALRLRPMIASFLVAFVVNTVLAWKYFFIIPVVTSGAISLCLALALVTARQRKPDMRDDS